MSKNILSLIMGFTYFTYYSFLLYWPKLVPSYFFCCVLVINFVWGGLTKQTALCHLHYFWYYRNISKWFAFPSLSDWWFKPLECRPCSCSIGKTQTTILQWGADKCSTKAVMHCTQQGTHTWTPKPRKIYRYIINSGSFKCLAVYYPPSILRYFTHAFTPILPWIM